MALVTLTRRSLLCSEVYDPFNQIIAGRKSDGNELLVAIAFNCISYLESFHSLAAVCAQALLYVLNVSHVKNKTLFCTTCD